MNALGFRLKRRYEMTLANLRSDLRFSPYLGILRIADDIFGRIGLEFLSRSAHTAKEQYILKTLDSQLSQSLADFKDIHDPGCYMSNAPIWLCWWSGEEAAPPLVQQCVASIRKWANGHPVRWIDQSNYQSYIHIPESMINKVTGKQMGLAHLSDYIRVSLLAQYGGLWLDATVFCSAPIPERYFQSPFFTCKSPAQPGTYVSQHRWTTFVLGGWKGQGLFRCLQCLLEAYWSRNDTAIDYLLLDYLIALCEAGHPYFRETLDAVPENNPHRDDLRHAMNQRQPASRFSEYLPDDTIFHKLSWRESYQADTPTGEDSVYTYFLNLT